MLAREFSDDYCTYVLDKRWPSVTNSGMVVAFHGTGRAKKRVKLGRYTVRVAAAP